LRQLTDLFLELTELHLDLGLFFTFTFGSNLALIPRNILIKLCQLVLQLGTRDLCRLNVSLVLGCSKRLTTEQPRYLVGHRHRQRHYYIYLDISTSHRVEQQRKLLIGTEKKSGDVDDHSNVKSIWKDTVISDVQHMDSGHHVGRHIRQCQ